MATRKKNSEAVHQQILEAANLRFQQYGFNKTTMAEIANDCDMSAANLYRYFKNKMDIVAHLAQRCMGEGEAKLQPIVNNKQRSASERLKAFALCQLQHHYDEFEQRPKLNELVDIVCQQHHYLVEKKISGEIAQLAQLIQQGVEQGEFESNDVAEDAEALHSALTLVSTPFFVPMFPRAELERKAQQLVRLILQGLKKR
ncbi:MAG: TetR/AcrR family transcriptional regulator [Gammaproteobacteria bacterium]|nr:TetR/AcrR family transcriptional regulator [Gammaproteobacteria bacterium]MCF6229952.1 TetR/AcrR family transcriptional regulator [Gammaproteobacteria bacterium]